MMDRLEASFRQATRFSADASHELKTPLAVMQGELENALQAATPGSPEQQLFTHLLEETQRLKTITRSLLLLAQADAGQLKLALEPVDWSGELGSLLEDARALGADLGLRFDVQLQPDQHIGADRGLLRAALFNLITNAVKYNVPHGRVEIRTAADPDQIRLRIGNTGPGIPPADQPKIFDRFFRVSRTGVARGDGIGLGLSLAREIVRAHGGELALQESAAGWTCFQLQLPRSKQ
jgi:two-component system, OmpR family, heavy metal sensor histidine kinase CusS